MMKKREYALVFLAGTIIVFGFLILSGTLFSGYHFLDDHEVVRMEYYYTEQHQSLMQIMSGNVKNDLNNRFRPLYWVERSVGSYVFGSNMLYWNIYTGIKGVLVSFLLYITARNLKCDIICSLLFVGVCMLGQQIVPFYRSANQESTGLLLCALTLWLISIQYSKGSYTDFLDNICFCIAAILCGLTKESFTLCMPALAGTKYWLDYCDVQETQSKGNNWVYCLKKNWWVYLVTAMAFLADMYLILFRVGVDKVSYAGFHSEIGVKQYLKFIWENLSIYLKDYTCFALAAVLCVAMAYDYSQEIDRNRVRRYLGLLIINLYVLGAELLTHAQSRMWERYLIPYIVSYAIIIVIMGYRQFESSRIKKNIYTAMLFFLILSQLPSGWQRAVNWRFDGQRVEALLNYIIDNSDADSKIICSFSDGEFNVAVESILEAKGYLNVISYRTGEAQLADRVILRDLPAEDITFETADIVVCYDTFSEEAMLLMGIEQEQCDISNVC